MSLLLSEKLSLGHWKHQEIPPEIKEGNPLRSCERFLLLVFNLVAPVVAGSRTRALSGGPLHHDRDMKLRVPLTKFYIVRCLFSKKNLCHVKQMV